MRMLVFGDAMVDVYVVGRTTRTNPEGPWPLVTVDSTESHRGGAANVDENLRRLGVKTTFLSGESATHGGLDIVKTRVILDGRTLCRIDEDLTQAKISVKYDLRHYGRASDYDAVVVSDYGKGSVDDELAKWVRWLSKPTYVDCKVSPGRWVDWATAMFPNLAEYEENKSTYDRAAVTVVKRGADGAELRLNGRPRGECASLAAEVKNVAGAGDTVLAAFATAAVADGRDRLTEYLNFAMRAAAVAVSRPLTYAPTLDDVASEFGMTPIAEKIQDACERTAAAVRQ